MADEPSKRGSQVTSNTTGGAPTDPDGRRPAPGLPAWTEGATPRRAFLRGVVHALGSVPAYVLFGTAIGFGALAHDVGIDIGATVLLTVIIYALPAQVVFVDQISRDAVMWTVAFAVTLTAIRLLPMTVTLMPYFRGDGHSVFWKVLAVHFVAITAWVEGHRRLPRLPLRLRLHFFIGLGFGYMGPFTAGTVLGYYLAASVPPEISAVLLLSTPIYFLLSLLAAIRVPSDAAAIAIGAVLGPILYTITPEFDLLIAGLAGGTIAWVIAMQRH